MEIIGAILNAGFLFFYLAVLAVTFLIAWKVYEKAGKPGWAASSRSTTSSSCSKSSTGRSGGSSCSSCR